MLSIGTSLSVSWDMFPRVFASLSSSISSDDDEEGLGWKVELRLLWAFSLLDLTPDAFSDIIIGLDPELGWTI